MIYKSKFKSVSTFKLARHLSFNKVVIDA